MSIGEWASRAIFDPFETKQKRRSSSEKKRLLTQHSYLRGSTRFFESGVAKELLDHWTRAVLPQESSSEREVPPRLLRITKVIANW